MGRVAKHGLSKHATKGFRLSVGKKPEGGYKTFWLGKDRLIAERHAETLQEQLGVMRTEGRDVWLPADEAVVTDLMRRYKTVLAQFKLSYVADVERVRDNGQLIATRLGNPAPAVAPATATPQAAAEAVWGHRCLR